MAELPEELLRRGERWRAPYASDPAATRGRVHAEPEDGLRSPFQRDRDRIVHSNAFRRLKQKTQVFMRHDGDHFRTRLTHTLEVAQIARSIARPLGLDEDLAEALALAHDLGHPPFGHAGERALNQALSAYEGFDHNAQSLRVVTELERRYPSFDGLNLSWETLEGLVKHNGPLLDAAGRPLAHNEKLPYAVRAYRHAENLQLQSFASLEAQAAAISDDIAYVCHDLEDGLRAGLLTVADLREQPLTAPVLVEIDAEHPGLEPARALHELVRRTMRLMILDVLRTTLRGVRAARIQSADDARWAGETLVRFSPALEATEADFKRYLSENVYRHDTVMRPVEQAEGVILDLYRAFTAEPSLMPDEWGRNLDPGEPSRIARRVADYIAGMTDRYAVAEHRRLFDATPDLG